MSEENLKILKEISHKLDQLIILGKLTNKDVLNRFKKQVLKDKISSTILDYADGSLSYTNLTKKVSEALDVADITVMKKISTLKEMGFLIRRRMGKEVYYEISDFF